MVITVITVIFGNDQNQVITVITIDLSPGYRIPSIARIIYLLVSVYLLTLYEAQVQTRAGILRIIQLSNYSDKSSGYCKRFIHPNYSQKWIKRFVSKVL